jgi:hypothetical protein
MKTVKMKPRFSVTIILLIFIITAQAQITSNMLTLPMLNDGNTLIEARLKAVPAKNKGAISWPSLKYIKVRRYELEKSADGVNFSYVTAKPGNAGKAANYSVNDEYLFEGANYYRLKIIDKNGNVGYSKVTSFDRSTTLNEINLMPAVVNDDLYVWLPANTQVSSAGITDAMGREVIKNVQVQNFTNYAAVPVSKLAAGIYKINIITSSGKTANLRFSKK